MEQKQQKNKEIESRM